MNSESYIDKIAAPGSSRSFPTGQNPVKSDVGSPKVGRRTSEIQKEKFKASTNTCRFKFAMGIVARETR